MEASKSEREGAPVTWRPVVAVVVRLCYGTAFALLLTSFHLSNIHYYPLLRGQAACALTFALRTRQVPQKID